MKTLAALLTVFVAQQTLAATQGDDKKEGIKYEMGYLDKTFGMKLKSAKHNQSGNSNVPGFSITLTLEFTKDLADADVPILKETFKAVSKTVDANLWFFLFDEDNVAIGKAFVGGFEGEFTGKKGDAIRVTFAVPNPAKIRKIEPRPPMK